MRRRALPSVEDICRDARRVAVLENVMNPSNVGAIFRSAAALNIDGVLLTSGSSDPLYRRRQESAWERFSDSLTYFDKKEIRPKEGMNRLKKLGFQTAAMALCEDSLSIRIPG